MKWMPAVLAVALAVACKPPLEPDPPDGNASPAGGNTSATSSLVVIDEGGRLAPGYDLLVNTDRGRTDWLNPSGDGLQAAYPSGQAWGFIAAVLQGDPAPGRRPGRDLSRYRTLHLQLRGATGGESVDIGIKDTTDPDDGNETKRTVRLMTSWQTVDLPLTEFTTADRTRIYLLFEIVFTGAPARTIAVRDVRYLP